MTPRRVAYRALAAAGHPVGSTEVQNQEHAMWDHFDGEKVDVRVSEKCGAYIMIEPSRIAEVEALLTTRGIPFTVEDGSNACLGTPEAAVIEFGKEADVERIQRVLDGVR